MKAATDDDGNLVFSNPERLNFKNADAGGPIEKFIKFFDTNDYDYGPVSPSEIVGQMTSPTPQNEIQNTVNVLAPDPDPCEVDDE